VSLPHLRIALLGSDFGSVFRYVDDMDSVDDVDTSNAPSLMCVVEQLRGGMGADERVSIGMIVICPSTGDVIWDEFKGRLLIECFFLLC
jgi:hypothetical protein